MANYNTNRNKERHMRRTDRKCSPRKDFSSSNKRKKNSEILFSLDTYTALSRQPSRNQRRKPEGAEPPIVCPSDDSKNLKSEASQEHIKNAYVALFDEETRQLVSFEEALALIKKREGLTDDDNLVYIGQGTFALMEEAQEENKKKLVFHKKFEFEKHAEDLEWRNALRYELSVPYEPDPEPLSELYTDEEIAHFPLNKNSSDH